MTKAKFLFGMMVAFIANSGIKTSAKRRSRPHLVLVPGLDSDDTEVKITPVHTGHFLKKEVYRIKGFESTIPTHKLYQPHNNPPNRAKR